ncbi:MAG: Eco57I restriction-modification methylase domain-containing protein [Alphaproteobacteria bacterium]|nr:Eco57I restriction-modification methylase domain-containing protein [Alphaproteobacteria bacterium]
MQQRGRDNAASRGRSVARLNGRVYTPQALADAIVAALPLRSGTRWLDPACGDGVFLDALMRRCAALGLADVTVEGWDVDPAAVQAAQARPVPDGVRYVVVHRDGLAPDGRRFDGVVGNPPYVESKRMDDGLKARVRAVCPVAGQGAFDLYAAFVERAARLLAPDGVLSLIVPNRLLVTRATAPLRAWLAAQGRVEVRDLSTTGVFDGAAVYPIVLTLRAGGPPGLAIGAGEGASVVPADVLGRLGVWPLPEPGTGGALLARLVATVPPLGRAIGLRWTVSFHRAGLRDAYVSADRPDSPHARPFLGGGRYAGNREVEPYRVTWAGTWIDHDEARARGDRNALPPLALFTGPKVAVCQNARRARAALDTTGMVLKDTFLLAHAHDGVDAALWLRWLVLVLHADVTHVVYEQLYAGTRKAGGYLHFLGPYLAALPVPDPPEGARDAILRLHDALAAGEPLQARAEAWVRAAYGVSEAEGAWLDSLDLPAR